MRNLIIFLLFLILGLPMFLQAQGFQKGRMYSYFGVASGLGNGSGSIEENVEVYSIPSVRSGTTVFELAYTNTILRQQLGKGIRLSSQSAEFGFEYALFKYFGIGFGVSNQTLTSNRFPVISFPLITIASLDLGIASGDPDSGFALGNTIFLLTQKNTKIMESTTADLGFYYHLFPNSTWDPYIRLGGGMGVDRKFGGRTNRVFGGIGLRYHADDHLFFSGELEHGNVYIVDYEPGSNSFKNRGQYDETVFRAGVGFAFLSPSDSTENSTTEVGSKGKTDGNDEIYRKSANVMERYSFLATEIFEFPSNRIHLEGRARIDAIARNLHNEYSDCEAIIITFVSPYRDTQAGWFDNENVGMERAKLIAKTLKDKGIPASRIVETTKGSSRFKNDPVERVIVEIRRK